MATDTIVALRLLSTCWESRSINHQNIKTKVPECCCPKSTTASLSFCCWWRERLFHGGIGLIWIIPMPVCFHFLFSENWQNNGNVYFYATNIPSSYFLSLTDGVLSRCALAIQYLWLTRDLRCRSSIPLFSVIDYKVPGCYKMVASWQMFCVTERGSPNFICFQNHFLRLFFLLLSTNWQRQCLIFSLFFQQIVKLELYLRCLVIFWCSIQCERLWIKSTWIVLFWLIFLLYVWFLGRKQSFRHLLTSNPNCTREPLCRIEYVKWFD